MGVFVTPEQVASWPMMGDIDRASVEQLIGYVESEVLALVKIDAVDCPLWVSGVVASAVGRAYSNPMRNQSEGVGPFSRRMLDSGASMLTKEERSRLATVGGQSGAFSIDTMPIAAGTYHSDACSLNFGALYCSCGADLAGFPLFGP